MCTPDQTQSADWQSCINNNNLIILCNHAKSWQTVSVRTSEQNNGNQEPGQEEGQCKFAETD